MATYLGKKDVRILLVGDPQVGKTSLILSLVSEEFPEEVPAKAEEITIPADVTPERVPTHIVDYSAQEQDEDLLTDEIIKAHVICVVYSVDDEDSIEGITHYWLPYIRSVLGEDHKTPIILVGNKVDLFDMSSIETILPIMNDFVEVETCVECSARTLKNISEMFYYAQKAVLHPTAPVYDAEEKELTNTCRKALKRVFKICDLDNDAVLNDEEINIFQKKDKPRGTDVTCSKCNRYMKRRFAGHHCTALSPCSVCANWDDKLLREFDEDHRLRKELVEHEKVVKKDTKDAMAGLEEHLSQKMEAQMGLWAAQFHAMLSSVGKTRRCFNAPLQAQALEDVKQVVRRHITDGVHNDGLTLKGFLFLHTLFIQRGRHETTWTVLRAFGYDDKLQLTQEFLYPKLQVGAGQSTELSHQGYQFLSKLFEKYDEDKDGCLSPPELQNLFCTCPVMPWGSDVSNTVLTDAQGWVTHKGYLAQWTLTTLLDHPRTLEYFAYLGYHYAHTDHLSAIQVTRDKKIDIEKRKTNRNVFQCHVIGAKGVGKTSFLQGLLNRNLRYVATLNRDHLSSFSINTVTVYGQEKHMLLHEVDVGLCDVLTPTELIQTCDVACLMYDITNPRSFEFIARIYIRHFLDSRIPVLIVASKAEHTEFRQDFEMTPAQFCMKYKLPPPHYFSCIDKISHDIYTKLATMAAYPNLKRMVHMLLVHPNPLWWPEKLRHLGSLMKDDPTLLVKTGLGVAVLASLGYILYRLARSNS